MKRSWVASASVLWGLFWGAVAVDSAVAYRRSAEAVERAVEADQTIELYEGPPEQPGQVQRWLFWQTPTLARLRELRRRARWWLVSAPIIALAGPPLLMALRNALPRRAA